MAHLVNLIGQSLNESETIEDLATEGVNLSNFINTDTIVVAHFAEHNVPKCARYVKTRWYSMATVIESLIRCRNHARKAVREAIEKYPNAPSKKVELRMVALRNLNDKEVFWVDLEQLAKLSRPLASCIAVAESSEIYLGETVKCFISYAKNFLSPTGRMNLLSQL